jgi:hypothetical protein
MAPGQRPLMRQSDFLGLIRGAERLWAIHAALQPKREKMKTAERALRQNRANHRRMGPLTAKATVFGKFDIPLWVDSWLWKVGT